MKILKTLQKINQNRLIEIALTCPLLLFIFGFNSCGKTDEGTITPPAKKPYLALVFCDITTSVDKDSIDKVVDKIGKIFDGLPDGSRIVAYPIDDFDFSETLLDYQMPVCKKDPNLTGEMANVAMNSCLKNIPIQNEPKKKELIDNIGKKYKELTANDESSKNKDIVAPHRSCIIDTLNKANKFFKDKNKEEYEFQVVYLSDMIEQCSSRTGSIYMCSDNQKPSKEGILSIINEKYNPDFKLNELVGNNISIVITTKMIGDAKSKCLYKADHEEIWKKVFGKVGYSEQDFSSFPFDTEIPDKFKRK